MKKIVTASAIIGSTLMALSLVGSIGNPANLDFRNEAAATGAALPRLPRSEREHLLAETGRLHALAKAAYAAGRYQDARQANRAAATHALEAGSIRQAAMNWNNAGMASIAGMQYGAAFEELSRARDMAKGAGELVPLAFALNNLASLYLQMGAPENALRVAQGALSGPASRADGATHARLLFQQAQALIALGRFSEGERSYQQAIAAITDAGDLEATARGWANLGSEYLDAGRYADAERALSESLRLVRTHRLKASAYVLANLGILRGKQGDSHTAELLFQNALDAHESLTPRWVLLFDRGSFRLESGNARGALEDFREARKLAMQMRSDIVPVDQDRVALENRVNKILTGLVAAGNRLATENHNPALLAETFDAAEQDRLWSLRSLVPAPNDWRRRLPASYWEALSRFQSAERSLMARPSPELQKQAADLDSQLQEMEAAAGSSAARSSGNAPFTRVRANLDSDAVVFSFLVTKTTSWLWTVDRGGAAAYALPSADVLRAQVDAFTKAVESNADLSGPGRLLYASLFGSVPAPTLVHKRWLIEPDGPLYDLPFAALPAGDAPLMERAEVQTIPGALMLRQGSIASTGLFFGVADPVFNGADPRYRGDAPGSGPILSRLPGTAAEVDACSRASGLAAERILTGADAGATAVSQALDRMPAVIHFATHVVRGPGEFGSGLIALALDNHGVSGLLGPREIVAHPLPGSLVVMNGCHSSQGTALPASGLMGLTRAWIGAGANAVISTRWDVPDDSAQSLMVHFYEALRGPARGNPARALRIAQLAALHSGGPDRLPSRWAGYFLLSRI